MAAMDTQSATPVTDVDDEQDSRPEAALVEDELVVEEISIDGMCGVY
jgi:mycofactocin precursor